MDRVRANGSGNDGNRDKRKGKEVQNSKKKSQESAFELVYPAGQGLTFRPLSFIYPSKHQQPSLVQAEQHMSGGQKHQQPSDGLAQQKQSWVSTSRQHYAPPTVQPPPPPPQPQHEQPSTLVQQNICHSWELEFENTTAGMSYTSMLNELTQIHHEFLGEPQGHHSAPSSSGPSTANIDDTEVEANTRLADPRPKKRPAQRDILTGSSWPDRYPKVLRRRPSTN